MTDLELIAIFAGSWIVAAAIWMLLDWAARPKHARFRPKGDRVHRGPLSYRHFRQVRRAEENEEIRLRVEQRFGRPTLALRQKRRSRVLARHDRMVTGIADSEASAALAPDPAMAGLALGTHGSSDALSDDGVVESDGGSAITSEPVYWAELRDRAMGFDGENTERLTNGEAPARYNPILKTDEVMSFDGTTAEWPSHAVDPFDTEVSTPSLPDDAADSDAAIGRAVRDLEHLPEAG